VPMMTLNNEFVQQLILLGLTAALTGLLVPYILKSIDDRRARAQRERDAQVARQSKIIEAQSKFLDDISDYLWKWRYLSTKLAYYGWKNMKEKYAQSQQAYDDESWDLFNFIRNEISRSRRLVSEEAYKRLVSLYKDEMVKLDSRISKAREEDESERCKSLGQLNSYISGHLTRKIDNVLRDLAFEVQLTEKQIDYYRRR
jgi:hypothetical protein